MKYPIFFGCLLVYVSYLFCELQAPWSPLLVWPICCLFVMTFSYTFRCPGLICGKKQNGSTNLFLILVNLPWLVFTWGIWFPESLVSREDAVNRIQDTNISIGRYPRFHEPADEYDLIIDLTAEFPKSREQSGYICLPNLDGVALKNTRVPTPIDPSQRVLIHCAQGHGRSATFAAIIMNQINEQISKEDAYKKITGSRPGAKISDEQRAQLRA